MENIIGKNSFPIDWKQYELKDLGRIFKGKGISKSEIVDSGLPCVRYGEIYTEYHFTLSDTKSFISEESASLSQEIQYGDVLFAGSGEKAEDIGKAVAYISNEQGYAGGDIIVFRPKEERDGQFLGYLLNSEYVNHQKFMAAQGHSVVHIYGKNVESLKIALPAQNERQKIAQILSKWDELIAQQTQLIAAKERQKKGLMQKLLTGEVRFPGFSGEWEEVQIQEIGTIIRGASPRPKGDPRYYGGAVPRLMVEDVTRDGKYVIPKVDFLTEAGAKKSRPCPKGTLTIVCSGDVGTPSFLAVDACIHDGFLAIIDINKKKVDSDFLYYQMFRLQDKMERSATHGGVFTNLTTSILKEFIISIPSVSEQNQISKSLN